MKFVPGLRVLEVAEMVSGPFAGQLLNQLGADVCKVERPGVGDPTRRIGPFFGDVPDAEGSGFFAYLNRGKSSISFDWDGPAGRRALERLLDSTDVLLVDESFDATYEHLVAISVAHPHLIVVSITPFGRTGPRAHWRGTHATTCAYSGLTLQTGEAGREPVTPPFFLGDYQAGLYGAIAAMLALYARDELGTGGQVADVSAVDALSASHTGLSAAAYVFSQRSPQRGGRRMPGAMYPYTILRCRDGYVRLASLTGKEWRTLLDLMGNPAWAQDPRFRDRHENQRIHADELDSLIEAWLEQYTKDELFAMFVDRGLPHAPVRTPGELLREPQLLARRFFCTVRLGSGASVTVPGVPFRIAGSEPDADSPVARAPRLGQHTAAVLGAASAAVHDQRRRPSVKMGTGTTRMRPAGVPVGRSAEGLLAGIVVLDLGQVWAGSVCGQVLGDFGAQVIKVESSTRLDSARQGRPIIGDVPDPNQSPMFHNVARNKKSLVVDLKRPEGREILLQLVAKADVLSENMRAGTLDRLGLGYSALRDVNPQIVVVSQSVTGLTGPMTAIRGYGTTISSVTGLDALVGYEDEPPLGLTHPYADPNVGLHAALLAVAALNSRRITGVGCHIDLSMWEAMVTALALPVIDAAMNGRSARPVGNLTVPGAPAGVFPCAGEDEWITIEVHTDEEWAALRHAMNNPGWASDHRFSDVTSRLAQRRELDERLRSWTTLHDRETLATTLQEVGVPAAPCLSIGDRIFDDHLLSRENFVWVEHPVLGHAPIFGQPARLSSTPASVRTPAPLLGEHSREVLHDLLGLDDSVIDALERSGVLR